MNYIVRVLAAIKKAVKVGYSWNYLVETALNLIGVGIPAKSIGGRIKNECYLKRFGKHNKGRMRGISDSANEVHRILVIDDGVLGDTVIILDPLKKLQRYAVENGISVTMICSSGAKKILSTYGDIKEFRYLCYGDRNNISALELKEIMAELTEYDYLLCYGCRLLVSKLAEIVSAENKLCYNFNLYRQSRNIQKKVKKSFNIVCNFPENTFIPNGWKKMLMDIGVPAYRTEIGRMTIPDNLKKKNAHILPDDDYLLICPEASVVSRSIDVEKCREVIHIIRKIDKNIKIVISTNARNNLYTQKLEQVIKECNITGYIGNTNLDEFFLLVQNAKLLIGCDSGGVHVAAALGVPSVCLNGSWDGKYFFPYKIEQLNEEDVVPVCLYQKRRM